MKTKTALSVLFASAFLSSALAEGITLTSDSLPNAMEGTEYTATLAAHGGVAPYAWSVVPPGYAEQSQASTFAEVGVAQEWQEDDAEWTLSLPFAFPIFGNDYAEAKVSSNGRLVFDGVNRVLVYVLDADLRTDTPGSDIFVESDDDHVTIRWKATYYSDGTAVNASATLFRNGGMIFAYGPGNANGGAIGIVTVDDNGDEVGEETLRSSRSYSGSMSNSDDVVFLRAQFPEWLKLSEAGVLSGTPVEPGDCVFSVAVTDSQGDSDTKTFTLTVDENAAIRPSFTVLSPDAGYVNMGAAKAQAFSVAATHPSGGAISYEWLLDGASVGTGAAYSYSRADTGLHTLVCVASGSGLAKTSAREWKVGTMTLSDPESVSVSYGQSAKLSVDTVSSVAATVMWCDADTDEELGTGEVLTLRGIDASRNVVAVAESALGVVTSAVATVTVDPKPAVGRIYKLTGPSFVGNRLVLRAKTYGDPAGATFAWKRNGTVVATTERLDIPALAVSDFGTYTFTMTNPHGTATTEAFVLEEAGSGVPYGWGASDHGRTTAPVGLSGVAQVASGMNFNLALKTDGTVAAWGYDGHGGCDVPDSLSGVSFVAAGGYESQGAGFAVKTDGTVVAWGQPAEIDGYWDWRWVDDYDEYGNWIGEHEERYWEEYTNGWDTVATMPAALSDVVQVAVGGEFAVALKADGSVVTWGWPDRYDVPDGLEDVVGVAAGGRFALALKADGTVVAWGVDWNEYEYLDVPAGLADVVSVAAAKGMWSCGAGLAVDAGGTLFKWGDVYDWTGYESGDAKDVVAVDAGQQHVAALLADGSVAVWSEWNNYGILDVPAPVWGGAIDVAAGGYHCTAILPDADGDSIPDAEEFLLGRDPDVFEDYKPVAVSGAVTVDGGTPSESVVVALYDVAGNLRARASVDETGVYSFDGVVPGRYCLRIEGDGVVDFWLDDVPPAAGKAAPFSTFAGERDSFDFILEPGQAPAYVQTELVGEEEDGDGSFTVSDPPPKGWTAYLDMWPAETVADAPYHGLIDLGEVAASHAAGLLSHQVTLRPAPGEPAPLPSPVEVDGEEGATVYAGFELHPQSGSVQIVTQPAGATVWIDYADEPLGVTPLKVDNLAAASHALLLRKEGWLQPRPIRFSVGAGETTAITVPLLDSAQPAVSAEVSSAIPGVPIYLDYLPTGDVTPAVVTGLDPASHAGVNWFSLDHSVLLRHEMMSPFAPRIIETVEAEGGGYERAVVHVNAPNTYEDSDGDGIRNDVEIASGTNPFDGWIPAYTVRFFANGGTGAMADVSLEVGETRALPANAFTRSGHAFLGWATSADGAVVHANGASVTDLASAGETVTLYAKWAAKTYSVAFNANGGTLPKGKKMARQSMTYGKSAKLRKNVFTRKGYVFAGWAVKKGGAVAFTDAASVKNLRTDGKTTTFYAVWAKATYKVKFVANGGKGKMAVQSFKYGKAAKLKANAFTRKGYVFKGWAKSKADAKNGKVAYKNKKAVKNLVTNGKTVTLYAVWQKK